MTLLGDRVEPDALAIAVDRLRARVAPTPVHGNRLPPAPAWPCVRVTQVAAADAVAWHLTATRVQVDCWGSSLHDDVGARDLAAACKAALAELPGTPHPQGAVTAVEVASGLRAAPDPTVDRARWTFDARIYATPHRTI